MPCQEDFQNFFLSPPNHYGYQAGVGFGAFIKKIRLHLGLSQEEFAKCVGVKSSDLVSDWERDEVEPPFDRLNRMVKLIDKSLTMEQCLVLPFEAPEAERKYRAIVGIIKEIEPPTALPAPSVSKPREARPAVNRGRVK